MAGVTDAFNIYFAPLNLKVTDKLNTKKPRLGDKVHWHKNGICNRNEINMNMLNKAPFVYKLQYNVDRNRLYIHCALADFGIIKFSRIHTILSYKCEFFLIYQRYLFCFNEYFCSIMSVSFTMHYVFSNKEKVLIILT